MKKHLLAFLTIASVFLCLCSNSANACYEIFDNQPLKQSNPHSFIRMVKFLFTTLLLVDQIHAFPVTRKPTVNPIRLSTPPEQENITLQLHKMNGVLFKTIQIQSVIIFNMDTGKILLNW